MASSKCVLLAVALALLMGVQSSRFQIVDEADANRVDLSAKSEEGLIPSQKVHVPQGGVHAPPQGLHAPPRRVPATINPGSNQPANVAKKPKMGALQASLGSGEEIKPDLKLEAPDIARVMLEIEQIMPKARAGSAMLLAGMLLTPFAASAADIEQGGLIFSGNCAACHAGGNNVIQAEKTLKKEALDQYLDGGRKESSVVYQVTNGKNAMPAFGGRLTDEEIANVAAYVIDQASGDKWE